MEQIACAVIGAGVIGLACARAMALCGTEVVILEAQDGIGMGTSSLNSEVIHAGIYYPAGTNKAKWCVAGRKLLYEYCVEKHIPHNILGKLIVASIDAELAILHDMNARAQMNGIMDLRLLSAIELNELEPSVRAVAALFSPSTGIIDIHAYMRELLNDAKAHGARLDLNTKVLGGLINQDGIVLQVQSDNHVKDLQASCVINCAGLYASMVARSIQGLPTDQIPETYYRKGNYFYYSGPNTFKHLVYPVPVPGGLGIHGTLNMAGQLRFGPDVEWIDHINYDVTVTKRGDFATAVRRYWPEVQEQSLQPGYAGIRPTLADKQGGFKDFCVKLHDVANDRAKFVGLYGIESPGLTSSLAIGDAVVEMCL